MASAHRIRITADTRKAAENAAKLGKKFQSEFARLRKAGKLSEKEFDRLTASTRKLQSSMGALAGKADKATRRLQRQRQQVQSLRRAFGGLKAAVAGFAAAYAVRGFVRFARGSIAFGDEIAKTADAIGITTDALQEWRHAAELAGVSQEALDKALGGFVKRLGEMQATGRGTLGEYLRDGNDELVRALTTAKRTAPGTAEALQIFTDALADTEHQAQRASLAAAAFGRQAGVRMSVLVRDGAESLREMRREAHDLGIVLREDLLRDAEKTTDQLTRVFKIFGIRMRAAVLEYAGQIATLLEGVIKNVHKVEEAFKVIGLLPRTLAERQAAAIGTAIADMGKQIETTGGQIEALRRKIGDLKSGRLFTFDRAGTIDKLEARERAALTRLRNLFQEQDRLRRLRHTTLAQDAVRPAASFDRTPPAPAGPTMIPNAAVQRALPRSRGHEAPAAPVYSGIMGSGTMTRAQAEYRRGVTGLVNEFTKGRIGAVEFNTALARLDQRLEEAKAPTAELTAALNESYIEKIKEWRETLAAEAEQIRSTAEAMSSAMSGAIESGLRAWVNGAEDWKGVMVGLWQDLTMQLLQKSLLTPATDFLAGGISAGLSALTAGFAGGAGGGGGAALPLGFASGGRPPVGAPSVVGERGPEMFVPRVPGVVVPNDQLRRALAGAGGSAINTNITVNGAGGDPEMIAKAIRNEFEFVYRDLEQRGALG